MIKTIIFFAFYFPFTGFCATLVILTSLVGTADRVHSIATFWGRTAFRVAGGRVETEGEENIPPDRPVIFISNHQSNFDIPTLYAGLPVQFRWLAKQELFDIPVFGLAMKRSGYIPVDRSDNRKSMISMKHAADRIRQGTSVVVFPEGTRSPDGKLLPFKKGGFMLALKSGVPVVPVAIIGSRDLCPKGSLRIRGGTIRVRFFEPIETADLTNRDRDDLIDRVFQTIAGAVEEGRRDDA
ncbi:MAG: 1-acyl-sn-glycerol-3-phosphate acyltransferase [Desulfuromonas sp.]|nr:MAG: 1-acyl-sn-glycerol-3-phosphate acyltransferase [Desulfuromonas sp.]